MILTDKNYYSKEANKEYMSSSQYKSFCECEAQAMAILNGDYERQQTDSMIQGSYVHAWNEGKLEEFKKENYAILHKKNGELYKQYEICEKVISVIKSDNLILNALSGEKEVIFTANYLGVPWKIKIDSYNSDKKRFCDLKVLKKINDKVWNNENHIYESIYQAYGYFIQIALYAEIERLSNNRGQDDYFEPFIAVVTKEEIPDKEIIGFNSTIENTRAFVETALEIVGLKLPRIIDVKTGKEKPKKCGFCDFCKLTKKLVSVKHYSEFYI